VRSWEGWDVHCTEGVSCRCCHDAKGAKILFILRGGQKQKEEKEKEKAIDRGRAQRTMVGERTQ